MFYIDTSVIIAALDLTDPRRSSALKFLQTNKNKAISELVIAELLNILARSRDLLKPQIYEIGRTEALSLLTILLYLIRRFDLEYYEVKGSVRTPLGRFSIPIGNAMELVPKIRLKTLDLLHISYIKALKDKGVPIRTLATMDMDFKKVEKQIRDNLEVEVYIVG